MKKKLACLIIFTLFVLTPTAQAGPADNVPGSQISLTYEASMYQPFVKKISGHEPMYFLVGVDPGIEKSSFQISFKYQFFNRDGYLGEKMPWIDGFHFRYTQKSFWDLDSDSAPFEDTSYKPEVFYLADKIDLGLSWISDFDIQAGFQHESNGQALPESRSTNYAYIKPIIAFPLWGDYNLIFAPKVWADVNNDDDTNSDLDNYRGYYELETKIGDPDRYIHNSVNALSIICKNSLKDNGVWSTQNIFYNSMLSAPLT